MVLNNTSMTFEALTELSIRFGEEICFLINDLLQKHFAGKIDFKNKFNVDDYLILSLFIDVLGYFRFIEGLELLEKILKNNNDYNDEVYIHVFKALVRIDLPVNINLENFLNHQNWVIRSQAARYIGQIKVEKYNDELLELLKDPKWWVRYYAAESLFKIGKEELLIKKASSDQESSEISNYILDLYN